MADPAELSSPRRLRRDPENGLVAGVLAGVANRLDADPFWVRVVFVVVALLSGGLAVVAYALGWAVLPGEQRGPTEAAQSAPSPEESRQGRRRRGRLALGVGLLTLAVLLSFRELGIWWSDALAWPFVLAAAGVALLWRQSGAAEPELETELPVAVEGPEARRASLVRVYRGSFGIALVVGAALLFLFANDALGPVQDAAITVAVVLVTVTLVLAPFLWRLGRRLTAERAARIRTEERAEVAAHLHDSVLQTLTLMQKRSDEPAEIAALARRQERELRAWLAGDSAPASGGFAAGLTRAAEEIEDAHRVAVDTVIVGDCELDPGGAAVVAAAREALTNAAKFGSAPISLYAEVDSGAIETYVRDRGAGFDPEAVPGERRGLRESIIGRMERHGGSAEVNTDASGTEIKVRIERNGR